MRRDKDLRKDRERGRFNLRAENLFGIIKDICRKIDRSKPANVFPTDETIKALKDYQIEFEQKKSEALAWLLHCKAFNR
jgi:hypothetical protein